MSQIIYGVSEIKFLSGGKICVKRKILFNYSPFNYSPFNIEQIEQIQLRSLLKESGDQGWWILQVLCENIQEAFQLGTIAHYSH